MKKGERYLLRDTELLAYEQNDRGIDIKTQIFLNEITRM